MVSKEWSSACDFTPTALSIKAILQNSPEAHLCYSFCFLFFNRKNLLFLALPDPDFLQEIISSINLCQDWEIALMIFSFTTAIFDIEINCINLIFILKGISKYKFSDWFFIGNSQLGKFPMQKHIE